jgi:hypothetical protein
MLQRVCHILHVFKYHFRGLWDAQSQRCSEEVAVLLAEHLCGLPHFVRVEEQAIPTPEGLPDVHIELRGS